MCGRSTWIVLIAAVAASVRDGSDRADAQSEKPVTVVAYGDMRFTDPANTTATNPVARTVLISRTTASSHRARIVVIAGHIHNYERFLQEDVMYLVSGGAAPWRTRWTARRRTCTRELTFRTTTT